MARKSKAPKQGMTKRERQRIVNWVMYGITALIAVAMLYSVVVMRTPRATSQQTRQIEQQQATQATAASAPAAPCPVRSGQDWEYDLPTNCYFDPSPGHGHWHPGRPPDPAERAQRMVQPPPPSPIQVTPLTPPPVPTAP